MRSHSSGARTPIGKHDGEVRTVNDAIPIDVKPIKDASIGAPGSQ
jgi:hypothetical protein